MIIVYAYGYSDDAKRKPTALVSCDDCGQQRSVRRESRLKEPGNKHRCKSCNGKHRARALHEITPSPNLGRTSPFKGKVRGPYKEPMTTSYIDSYGYRQIWCGRFEGSRGRKDGYRAEHHLVAEDAIGRSLLPGEVVHHIDGNKLNNSPENLYVCSGSKEHRGIHNQLESIAMKLVKDGTIVWNDGEYMVATRVVE